MFKISLQLEVFASSEIYRAASTSDKSLEVVNAWLSGRADSVPWAGIFEELCKASLQLKLAKALTRVLNTSETVLNDDDNGVVLAPETEAAASEAFKLAFFFLCHLAKATNSSLLVCHLCTKALVAVNLCILEALDKRSAEILLLTTLLEVLAGASSPSLSDASLKSAAAATKKTAVVYLAECLCDNQETRVLEALFTLAEQPKQNDSVLKDIASIFLLAMQRSEIAGCSVVAAILERAAKNSTGSSDNLASILLTLSSSKDPAGAQLRASLLAQPAELSALFHHPRAAVKKAALEIAATLGFGISSTAIVDNCWSQIAFSAVQRVLRDPDANLRGKALTILENYATEVVAAAAAASSTNQESFAASLENCLIDRSVTARKKTFAALEAIVAATINLISLEPVAAQALLSALQAKTMPTVCNLLQLSKDSKLYPGDSVALCSTFISLAQPAQSPAGALSLLSLIRNVQHQATICLKLQAALAEVCLPLRPNDFSASTETSLLEAMLQKCTTQQELADLGSVLQSAEAANRTLAARMHTEFSRVSERLSELVNLDLDNSNKASMTLHLSKMIYVLGPPPQGAPTEVCAWLLDLTERLATQNTMENSAIHWCLLSLKVWMEQLGSVDTLAQRVFYLVVRIAAFKMPDALKTALSLLHMLSNSREAFETVLYYNFPTVADITKSCDCPAGSTFPVISENELVSSIVPFLSIVTAMADLYKREKAEFLDYLKQQQKEIQGAAEENVVGDNGGGGRGDDRFLADLAQKYLDDLLEAPQDTLPAAFIPYLLTVFTETLADNPPAIKVEALKALEALAVLSHRFAEKCIGIVTSLLQLQSEYAKPAAVVTVQATKFLKAVIQAFPTAYGSRISLFGPLLSCRSAEPTLPSSSASSASSTSNEEIVAITAAISFSELLLSNTIKVHDFLGLLGIGLASTCPTVASTCSLSLRQLLLSSSASSDRAAFVLGISHQTSLKQRHAATAAAFQLLPEVDLGSDALVAPCITAALNAFRPAAALGADFDIQVVVEMLRGLSPSVKMLKMLQKGLLSCSTSNSTNNPLLQALEEFVKRAGISTTSSEDADNLDNLENMDTGNIGPGASGKKRGRPVATTTAPATKAVAAAKKLQQDLLGLLAAKTVDHTRRSNRK
jgi:hypothetical protein